MGSASPRVLIIGSRAELLVPRLEARGYACETAIGSAALQRREKTDRPDAVVLASTARVAPSLLAEVRKRQEFRRVPVLIDGTEGWRASLQRLDVDGVAETFDGLERQLAASLKARRAMEHDDLVRRRLELMLDLTRLSVSGASLESLVRTASAGLRESLDCEGVAVLQQTDGRGVIIGEDERTPVDLAVAPTFRAALERRTVERIEQRWIVPLAAELGELAAMVVTREAPLEQEELDLLQAVGVALANALERQRQQQSDARSKEALEDAYVERYRELLEANSRLRTLDRKKNEIMAVLSHDLRAPLNVLLGYAHLLGTDDALTATHRQHAEAISRAGKKVLSLVENLLDQTRTGENRVALFSRTFDISEACQEAARDLQLLARQKGVALRAEAPLSIEVFADDQKVRQVLQNLVTNALTHSRQAKTVVLRARLKKRPDGDVAQIEVRDDGQVADPNDVLLAFERSRGLGLSICRDYVERHGGEIWAEAPPEGGAVFSFTLPLPTTPVRPVQPRTSEPVVLIVDDDPVFSRMATLGLSGHFRVELARDGHEAVERARRLSPDLILMDVFMPNRDGLDALRELHATPETEAIPVILLSSRPELPERFKAAELGAVDFLAKPLPPSVLLARVQAAVQRARGGAAARVGPGMDPETGLFDVLGVANQLDQELSRSVRYGRPLALAMLKPLSSPGDRVGACAGSIRRELEPPDFVGHLGDGVFVVVLPETNPVEAQRLVDRLVAALGQQCAYRSRLVEVKDGGGGAEKLLEGLLA